VKNYRVLSIDYQDCKEWFLKKHYLKRLPSISFCFGLYKDEKLIGVCSFGNAVPLTMKRSICGKEYEDLVYELNRLIIEDNHEKNITSYFVSKCFKLLPKPLIIVSYADKEQGHNGYIYQATNFIYLGFSHTQKDWKIKGQEDKHSRTLMDEFAFTPNRIELLKEKYGDLLYQVERKPKHRYVYFLGSRSEIKNMRKSLKYEIKPYPKGDNKRYDASFEPTIQIKLF
jgi:hypothetical protein